MPRGGRRAGAGRPKGSKEPQTLEREAVLKAYRDRVCRVADRLLDAELAVAQGCSFLYRKPKAGKERKSERVTDPEVIRRFLDGELDNDESDWYFIVAEKPDTLTIRGMFDRLWDKPGQRHEVSGPEGGPIGIKTILNNYVTPGPDAPTR
jgi:hypothetical protein